jgi:hypothetical protein
MLGPFLRIRYFVKLKCYFVKSLLNICMLIYYFVLELNIMIKYFITASFMLFTHILCAQESIKVGEDSTILCTGQFIAEVQNFYSNGLPSCKSRTFVDAQKDSLIFFTALIDDKAIQHVVFRYAVAKKDVDTGDWGFEIEAVKENGAAFQMLQIKSVDGNSVITEEKYAHNEVEKSEHTNRVHIYFNANAQAEAKVWADKIRKML